MQHAGLQYGQGAANSHQSPPFAHADISQSNGGNTTSSLRQFRKKDGTDKTSSTDLNTSIENSHIARVPPHNHYPARPNDYYRYQHQYPDYNSPFKETPAQVKYSEIAETPPQPIQHVDHLPAALQKHKDVHKDYMDMCNISQQTHMKQNYPDNLARQQSYPPDAASVHHQYLHKEPQVHPGYKPESQYQQYPQIPKYNMPSQCRKYPPPPPENDFLAKLQRINPSMARSIMSDHHIRESQGTYPAMDQNRMYPQNQRYYPPTHIQNNLSYNYQPYNYPSSCNYKHPDYARTNQMAVGGAQYPAINPHADRSMSPRNLHMMNYGTSPQKISPNYSHSQYNPPEYAQHYQHRRASLPQDYYQQPCRNNPYMSGHQISPEPSDNRGAGGGLRHFIENWAEEEGTAEITPIFKENIRIHNNESTNEQVFVINSSDIPQCLENVSLVPTENGQFIIKTGALDNSVVRIKETTENNGERTVNLQIVEAPPKPDCLLAEANDKPNEETPVPYQENQNQNEKICDPIPSQPVGEKQPETQQKEESGKSEEAAETSVIVANEASVIKDMPLIDEEHKNEEKKEKEQTVELSSEDSTDSKAPSEDAQEDKETGEQSRVTTTTRRTQRIFSVDDIINNIGSSPTQTRRNSLQFVPKGTDDDTSEDTETKKKEESEDSGDQAEYRNAISVEDDSVILEIGGAWVQLNINHHNGTKVLSVLPLSESLVIDVNGNYQPGAETANEENLQSDDQTDDADDESKSADSKIGEEEKSEDVTAVEENLQNCEPVADGLPSDSLIPDGCENDATSEESTQNEEVLTSEDLCEENLQNDEHLDDISADVCQSEVVIGEESAENDIVIDLNNDAVVEMLVTEEEEKEEKEEKQEKEETEEKVEKEETVEKEENEEKKEKEETEEKEAETPKPIEVSRRRDEKRKSRDGDEKRKSSKKAKHENRREGEERSKLKKSQKIDEIDGKVAKKDKNESESRKDNEDLKKKDSLLTKKYDKKVVVNDDEARRKEKQEEAKLKKQDRKLTPQSSVEEDETKKKDVKEAKKSERKAILQEPVRNEEEKKDEDLKVKKQEKKLASQMSVDDDDLKQVEVKKLTLQEEIDVTKMKKIEKKLPSLSSTEELIEPQEQLKRETRLTPQSSIDEEEAKKATSQTCPVSDDSENRKEEQTVVVEETIEESPNVPEKEDVLSNAGDLVQAVEEMITLKQLEESKEGEKLQTKAAKKLYVTIKEPRKIEDKKQKKSLKIEETVNKIKSLKEKSAKYEGETKKTALKETIEKKSPRITKKVTFKLETEVREISKEEIDRKKLSWEEYNSRKRRSSSTSETEETKNKIMEDTVTSTYDMNDEVVEKVTLSIETAVKDSPLKRSPPRRTPTNWEDDTPSPESPTKNEAMSTTNRKCIIDVNEFNIKPIESVSTPSPVSSSQFSYHSEDDSLQVYKDVVDSKLNSLNIKIPKLSKPKPVDRFSVLLDRFLNKGTLNCEELEEVKKFIEIKRKMMAEEKKLTYEVRNERDYKDLKLHFRKVPEKRKKKRFRNLYAEDSSDESDSSRSEKGAGDYSVYQRDSQGVPKLIIKRNSGLPQPFVKLERSQAVELLAKKRKLY